jgi:CRP/FNR family cyclic AMP-dependent transcriptional regulator
MTPHGRDTLTTASEARGLNDFNSVSFCFKEPGNTQVQSEKWGLIVSASMNEKWFLQFELLNCTTSDIAHRILSGAQLSKWTSGSQIVRQFDVADRVYFLLSGTCRAEFFSVQGTCISFRTVMPGQYFGELAVLTDHVRTTAIIAQGDVITAHLKKSEFMQLLSLEPLTAVRLAVSLAKSIQTLTNRLVENTTLTVNERIWAELKRLAMGYQLTAQKPIVVPMITHGLLASIVGANREAVTRELRALRRSGVIDYDRSKLSFLKPELLAADFDISV